jgi:hypothetical protein
VPGQVEGLSLNPCSDNIIVNWKKPILNSYCVMNYIIEWGKNLSASEGNHEVPSDVFSYTIEDLEACEGYEVSVTAVNEIHEDTDVVTGKTAAQTKCNSHTHNAYYIYILVAIMMLVNI